MGVGEVGMCALLVWDACARSVAVMLCLHGEVRHKQSSSSSRRCVVVAPCCVVMATMPAGPQQSGWKRLPSAAVLLHPACSLHDQNLSSLLPPSHACFLCRHNDGADRRC
jgi:hypothetical protein